uniref:RHS repeat domain-containing protein n=2 Tax=Paenibacillus humicus TaxID=412861 RepID=UPI002482CBA9|nr:RHS repeat-associated core domain-containing protein [Paenibacillus humicus]
MNSYDALNRLIEVKQPNGERTSYGYSLAGALKKITHPDGTIETSQYDELGRRMQHTDGSGKSKKYLYDKAGNVTKLIDKGYQTTTYEYNNRNWLTRKTAGGSSVGYQYDNAGRRTSMTDGTGTTGYYFTPGVGELEKITYPDGKQIQFTYNKHGLRSTMTDPFGLKLYYGYDELNRLKKVGQTETTAMAEYSYHSNGLLKDIKLENGTSSTMNYNGYDLSDLTQLQGASTVINRHSYTWSPDGNQLSKTDLVAGQSKSVQYGYDSLNRIETSTEFNELYVYDSRGNRQTLVSDQAPKLQEASYNYDGWNQLTGASVVGKSPVAYKYNGDGLMVERTENGSTRRYYYDGDQIIAEATVSGSTLSPVAQYIRGKQLIARLSGTTKHYYYYNGHGDVTELRNNTGALVNRYSYDMWGNPLTVSEQVANPFRYSGEYWDSTTELQYLRARWYDPSMGRFISEDTYEGQIDNPLSLNLYTYVINNPLKYVDPTGHEHEKGSGGGGGGGAGAGSGRGLDLDAKASALFGKIFKSIKNIPAKIFGKGNNSKGVGEVKTPTVAGRGQSKGGHQPTNLKEQLAVEESMSNPAAGKTLEGKNTDPRWPADEGWVKKAQNVNGVEVHYTYNTKTGEIDDFKIK